MNQEDLKYQKRPVIIEKIEMVIKSIAPNKTQVQVDSLGKCFELLKRIGDNPFQPFLENGRPESLPVSLK